MKGEIVPRNNASPLERRSANHLGTTTKWLDLLKERGRREKRRGERLVHVPEETLEQLLSNDDNFLHRKLLKELTKALIKGPRTPDGRVIVAQKGKTTLVAGLITFKGTISVPALQNLIPSRYTGIQLEIRTPDKNEILLITIYGGKMDIIGNEEHLWQFWQ